MKKIIFLTGLLMNFIIFSEMTTENIIESINSKDYNTAAKNLIVYQKESKFKISNEKDAVETVKNIYETREQLIKNYKNINISNYKAAFSKDINTGEIQGLLAAEELNPAGFVKILNNLDNDSFLIDFFTDDPDSEYGIYALRSAPSGDDYTIIIQITKENNVYKITEVTNYR
jgi:hypothetical protein